MIIRTPDYYAQFKCIAGACTDTCCAGWQVDVDDASFAYYKTIQGEFGERLRSVMIEPTKKAEGQFRIRENGRCPFLNEDNLCDLYTALGEEGLCVTCDRYPRFTTEFGNLREVGIALSCKTAAELILRPTTPATLVEEEDPGSFPSLNEIDGLRFLMVMKTRDYLMKLLSNRSYSIWERMIIALYFATDVQKCMRHPDKMEQVIERYTKEYERQCCEDTYREQIPDQMLRDTYATYFAHYMRQVIIREEWPEFVKEVYHTLYDYPAPWEAEFEFKAVRKGAIVEEGHTIRLLKEFVQNYERMYEFENLMMYFIFRYYASGILDGDVLTKVKMAVVGTLILLQCDATTFYTRGALSFTEQVEICHLYSREVEHSEENFRKLHRIFAKKKEFGVKRLALLLAALRDE